MVYSYVLPQSDIGARLVSQDPFQPRQKFTSTGGTNILVMDQQELSSIHSVLHLIYHRNKNQHQRAKWWKWLAALKRSTSDVALTQPAAEHAYRRHLIDNIIPRCYLYVDDTICFQKTR